MFQRFLTSAGIGLFLFSAFVPATLAAQETALGTRKECLAEQAEMRRTFDTDMKKLQARARVSQRDSKLVDTFRQRMEKQGKMTEDMRKLLDAEEAWGETLGGKVLASLQDQDTLIDGICSDSPAVVKQLFVDLFTSKVELNDAYVRYLVWIQDNQEAYRKTLPVSYYKRKVLKWLAGKTEAEKDLSDSRENLQEVQQWSTTSF